MKLEPKQPTPAEVIAAAYKAYRKHTRPFRRTFRGIISRREAERLLVQAQRLVQRGE